MSETMPTLGGSALTPALSPRERKERAATWEKFEVAMAIGLVLDQGVPRDAARQLRDLGYECTHVGEIGWRRPPTMRSSRLHWEETPR